MGLFGKGKSLQEQAMDQRAKAEKQQAQLQEMRIKREMIHERRKTAEEMRRLTA